jgi:hypothetical protein
MMNALFDCRRSCEAMGTRFEAFLAGDDAEHLDAVAVAVLEEIARLDGALSRFDPRGEISRINREAADHLVRVDREVFALLERCEQARRITEGYFDITRESGETPALLLDAEVCTARLARPGVAIDLGGVGKGYALDRGREILLRYGVTCALLHGGTSSVLALGKPRDRDGWPVGIRHPLASATRLELVEGGAVFDLKSVEFLTNRHRSLLMQSLMLADLAHAKLINFHAERVEHAFVNNTSRLSNRRDFNLAAEQWSELSDKPLQPWFTAFPRSIGAGLDISLYEEAISYWYGGEEYVLRDVDVTEAKRVLGAQKFHLLAPRVAFKATASLEDPSWFEQHVRKIFFHTRLEAVQWINVTRNEVVFRTLRR